MSESNPDVLVERQGHVMVITINREAARNAVNENLCLGVDDALAFATAIADNAPLSVKASKRIARQYYGNNRPADDEQWAHTREESKITHSSADSAEGPKAFAEQRKPVWTGR